MLLSLLKFHLSLSLLGWLSLALESLFPMKLCHYPPQHFWQLKIHKRWGEDDKVNSYKMCTLFAALIKVLQVIELFWVVATGLSLDLLHLKRWTLSGHYYCTEWDSFILFCWHWSLINNNIFAGEGIMGGRRRVPIAPWLVRFHGPGQQAEVQVHSPNQAKQGLGLGLPGSNCAGCWLHWSR